MKEHRLEIILDLISEFDIDRQEDLLRLLNERGFNVTQATVSRDIKTLKLIKHQDENGVYKYMKPTINTPDTKLFTDAIVGTDYAINTVVLKCRTGMAQAVCASLDSMNYPDIVGTLAGDDTIFILMRSENDARAFSKKLAKELEL